MKKKIFGTIFAAVLIAAQTVTAFAAGSKTGEVALVGDSAGYYEVEASSADVWKDLDPTVLDKIQAVNAGEETLQSIAELAPDLAEELEGKSMVTPFFDLEPINGGLRTDDGQYLVTLSVPALAEGMTDVEFLHYSTERNVWEIVVPTNVDLTNKEVDAQFQDLSPVAVIADTSNAAAADTATGTSPKTGMTNSWMVWIGAAAVLAAVCAVTYRKERKQ